MSKLVRKINRNNWPDKLDDISSLGADAITQCLKTKGNAISVFQIPSEDQLDEVFLALTSNADHVETTDLVAMDQDQILELGMSISQTPGNTPIDDLKKIHHDITEQYYSTLALIASHVFECVCSNHWKRRTRGELKSILLKAIDEERLNPSMLKDGVKKDLGLIPR